MQNTVSFKSKIGLCSPTVLVLQDSFDVKTNLPTYDSIATTGICCCSVLKSDPALISREYVIRKEFSMPSKGEELSLLRGASVYLPTNLHEKHISIHRISRMDNERMFQHLATPSWLEINIITILTKIKSRTNS